jgi:PAT family beta-lactamase induction signal transducer AmpG
MSESDTNIRSTPLSPLERAAKEKDYPKLITLAILNMAQNFPQQFTATALPFMFRKEGLPLEMFWLLALPNLPTWLRWLMALLVDRYGSARFGYRKSWIVPCTLVGTIAYAILALFPPSIALVHLIVAILLFKAFVMVAQDVAIDAYCAESMTDAERPVGTSIINFCAGIAGVLGTGTVALVEMFGWKPTMLGASALLLIAAAPAIIRREPPPPEARQKRQARGEGPNLWKALKRPESRYILPFTFSWGFAAGLGGAMVAAFYADKGLTLTQFGILSPISSLIGTSLAAVTTPWLIERIGMRKTALIGISVIPIEGAMFCIFALTSLPPLPILIAMVSLLSYITALYTYSVCISRYRWASKAQAGTDYALQSSLAGFGVYTAASIAGFLAGGLGWVYFLPLASFFAVAAGVFYVAMFNRIETLVRERERLELEELPNDEPDGLI